MFVSQGHRLAAQLGHSIVDSVPSLFTFKIADSQLTELSGVSYSSLLILMETHAILVVARFCDQFGCSAYVYKWKTSCA